VLKQTIELFASDLTEVEDPMQMIPSCLDCDPVSGQCHGEQLVNHDGPTTLRDMDILYPARFGEFNQSDCLNYLLWLFAKERGVCGLAFSSSGPTHALQE